VSQSLLSVLETHLIADHIRREHQSAKGPSTEDLSETDATLVHVDLLFGLVL
jgi:hypothetical protein